MGRYCYRSLTVAMLIVLTSCFGGNDNDTKNFVAKVKQEKGKPIDKIPEEKVYEPFIYSADLERNPFLSLNDLIGEVESYEQNEILESKQSVRPDINRERDPLERFSLDSLTMAGIIKDDVSIWGLILDENGILHRVKTGDYIGENSGHILQITDREIILEELVVDGQGGWTSRSNSLTLQ